MVRDLAVSCGPVSQFPLPGRFRIAIVTWIERIYYRRRRQAALGLSTPIEFDTIITTQAGRAAERTPSPFFAADPAFEPTHRRPERCGPPDADDEVVWSTPGVANCVGRCGR